MQASSSSSTVNSSHVPTQPRVSSLAAAGRNVTIPLSTTTSLKGVPRPTPVYQTPGRVSMDPVRQFEYTHSERRAQSADPNPTPRPIRSEQRPGSPDLQAIESRGRSTPEKRLGDERKKEEDDLRRQIKDIDNQIIKFKGMIADLEQNNKSLTAQNIQLETIWRNQLQQLDAQRQTLNASRSFASREGTVDAQGLIRAFSDLNSSIGDLSYEVLRGIDAATETRILNRSHYDTIGYILHDPALDRFLRLIRDQQLTPMDILDPIVQYVLCAQLMHTIFGPFAPGLDMDRSNALHRMYQRMRSSEPQERSARWRTITYTHIAPMRSENFVEEAADQYIKNITEILVILSENPDATLSNECLNLAKKIFQDAVKVQDKAKKEYVSFDYIATFPASNDIFNPKTMEVSQGGDGRDGQAAEKVYLTIGLGMEALKCIVREDRSIAVETSAPVKASVICNNWDPNA